VRNPGRTSSSPQHCQEAALFTSVPVFRRRTPERKWRCAAPECRSTRSPHRGREHQQQGGPRPDEGATARMLNFSRRSSRMAMIIRFTMSRIPGRPRVGWELVVYGQTRGECRCFCRRMRSRWPQSRPRLYLRNGVGALVDASARTSGSRLGACDTCLIFTPSSFWRCGVHFLRLRSGSVNGPARRPPYDPYSSARDPCALAGRQGGGCRPRA